MEYLMNKHELSGYQARFNASEEASFAHRHFNVTPGSAAEEVAFLNTYNNTRIADIHGFKEVQTPAGKTVAEIFDSLKKADTDNKTTSASALHNAFTNELANDTALKTAEKKYQNALADLNKERNNLSYPTFKRRLNKIYKDFEKDLEDDCDGKKKKIEQLFQARPNDIDTWFGLTTPKERDDFKDKLLHAINDKHKDGITEANKLVDAGTKKRDEEYGKNLGQLIELAKLFNYPENRKYIIRAIKTVEQQKGISLLPTNSSLSSGFDTIDRNILQHITVADVYEELKKATIERKSSWNPIGSEYLMIGSGVKLEYNPETDSNSFNIPGYKMTIKLSKFIYFEFLDNWDLTLGGLRMSEEELKDSLSAQLKFIKAMKDDVSFTVSAPTEKRAMHLARLACEEALLAGFKEENIQVTIVAEGVTKQVTFKDIFPNGKADIDRRVQQEDQRRNNSLAINRADQDMFKQQMPRRTPPAEAKEKKEEKDDAHTPKP